MKGDPMTLLELVATIALIEFMLWAAIDIIHKIQMITGREQELRLLRKWRDDHLLEHFPFHD
jgi:hypothetical protein